MEACCKYAGISFQTYRNWMKRGQAAKTGEYFEFVEDTTRAQAEAEVRLVALINKASIDDWRAGSFILERRFSNSWSNVQRIKIEAQKQTNEALSFILNTVSDSAKAEIAAALSFTEHANQDEENSSEDVDP